MNWKTETVALLETQLDDITGQEVGYLLQLLLDKGALDAVCIPILMKKGRPGYLIQVLCLPRKRDFFCELLFDETSTLGVRYQNLKRNILPRREAKLKTPYGPIRAKAHSWKGKSEVVPEFDALMHLAKRAGRPLQVIRRDIKYK